jgi:hypothetical protein
VPVAPSRNVSGIASSHAAYSAWSLRECGDGGVPLLRSTGPADRLRRAARRRSAVVGLAIEGLTLGPGQRALPLRFAASAPHTTPSRSAVADN